MVVEVEVEEELHFVGLDDLGDPIAGDVAPELVCDELREEQISSTSSSTSAVWTLSSERSGRSAIGTAER